MIDDLTDLSHPRVMMVVAVIMIVVVMMIVAVVMIVMVIVVVIVMVMVIVVVIMVMVVMVIVIVMVIMIMAALSAKVSVQVLHVVVVTIVFFVRDHVKVTALDPRLFHTADLYPEMTARDPVQDMLQFSAVRPQIQKRRDHHIAADPRTALEIQNSITVFQSLFLRRQAG